MSLRGAQGVTFLTSIWEDDVAGQGHIWSTRLSQSSQTLQTMWGADSDSAGLRQGLWLCISHRFWCSCCCQTTLSNEHYVVVPDAIVSHCPRLELTLGFCLLLFTLAFWRKVWSLQGRILKPRRSSCYGWLVKWSAGRNLPGYLGGGGAPVTTKSILHETLIKKKKWSKGPGQHLVTCHWWGRQLRSEWRNHSFS